MRAHSSSLHCSHTQALSWNPRFSNIVPQLTMPLNKRLSHVGRAEVDYWIRHGVIQILSLVSGLKWLYIEECKEIQWIPQGQLPYDDPVLLGKELTLAELVMYPWIDTGVTQSFRIRTTTKKKIRVEMTPPPLITTKPLAHSNSTTTTVRQRNPNFALQQLQNRL